jgi:hypothetical protein
MDHGPSLSENPEYFIYKSKDGNQISLAVRGLRPIHIADKMAKMPQISAEFERLIESDRCTPAGSTFEYVDILTNKDNSSDLFSSSR